MNIKYLSIALLATFSSTGFTQYSTGQINTSLDVSVTIPQLCSFSAPKLVMNLPEYLGVAINHSTSFYASCYQNTIMDVEVSMGSNPNSTIDRRRLPLNGEGGDIENYIPYSIQFNSYNGPNIGDGINKQTYTFSSASNIYFYLKIPADLDLKIGSYSDKLDLTFTYY